MRLLGYDFANPPKEHWSWHPLAQWGLLLAVTGGWLSDVAHLSWARLLSVGGALLLFTPLVRGWRAPFIRSRPLIFWFAYPIATSFCFVLIADHAQWGPDLRLQSAVAGFLFGIIVLVLSLLRETLRHCEDATP